MKLAILYAGPYRGTYDILDNHIKTFGENIDMYVSCFEHYLDDWKSSGWPIKEYYVTPYVNFKETNWSKYRNNEPGQCGFWQFWNLKNVIDNIPKNYDFYIKNRNDLVFETKFNFDFNNTNPNTIYSPNNSFHKVDWDIDMSINDEFLLCDLQSLLILANFVSDYYNTNRHSLNEASKYVGSNESSLRLWLKENNVNIEKIHNFKYKKNHDGNNVPSGEVKFQLEKI